jgi:hypothetical protein
MNDKPWEAIAKHVGLFSHDFDRGGLSVTAQQIKQATRHFKSTNEREVRILCKQDSRENRPSVFVDRNLFLLPTTNGEYMIVCGEGYVDIPPIAGAGENYRSSLTFDLHTSKVGNSEMQHLDFAYASSLIRTFTRDDSLVLTIRGRKYTPRFNFRVGETELTVESVQTEVDAGYEGRNQVVLVEAKNAATTNTIIRQLFYPFRQWQEHTSKPVLTLFFQRDENGYSLWQFRFKNPEDYNSIELVRSARFTIENNHDQDAR